MRPNQCAYLIRVTLRKRRKNLNMLRLGLVDFSIETLQHGALQADKPFHGVVQCLGNASPSRSSRARVSRIGVRLTPYCSARSTCANWLPPGSDPSRMRSRNSLWRNSAKVGRLAAKTCLLINIYRDL